MNYEFFLPCFLRNLCYSSSEGVSFLVLLHLVVFSHCFKLFPAYSWCITYLKPQNVQQMFRAFLYLYLFLSGYLSCSVAAMASQTLSVTSRNLQGSSPGTVTWKLWTIIWDYVIASPLLRDYSVIIQYLKSFVSTHILSYFRLLQVGRYDRWSLFII